MIENTLAAKPHQKLSSSDYDVLTDLLVSKDKEIKDTLKVWILKSFNLTNPWWLQITLLLIFIFYYSGGIYTSWSRD